MDQANEALKPANQGQTGPKSTAGKNRSKFNALKTGLYAKSPVLPFEDDGVYKRHVKSIVDSLDPEDALQSNLAQQIADSLWRGTRQEYRAVLHREEVFKELTPKIMAGFLELTQEQADNAPQFLVMPNHRFGRKDLQLHRQLYANYEHWRHNSKGVANYQMVWRNYVELFTHLASWMKPQIRPDLFMNNGQGLDLAWQQHPKELEEYLVRYGHYLWFVVNFESYRGQIRNWMAIWYFLKGRHAGQVDHYDDVVIRERRVCQGLMDSYFKLRKSKAEHVFMRHSQLVISRPDSMQGLNFDTAKTDVQMD